MTVVSRVAESGTKFGTSYARRRARLNLRLDARPDLDRRDLASLPYAPAFTLGKSSALETTLLPVAHRLAAPNRFARRVSDANAAKLSTKLITMRPCGHRE
jgi:hypothetical protein